MNIEKILWMQHGLDGKQVVTAEERYRFVCNASDIQTAATIVHHHNAFLLGPNEDADPDGYPEPPAPSQPALTPGPLDPTTVQYAVHQGKIHITRSTWPSRTTYCTDYLPGFEKARRMKVPRSPSEICTQCLDSYNNIYFKAN